MIVNLESFNRKAVRLEKRLGKNDSNQRIRSKGNWGLYKFIQAFFAFLVTTGSLFCSRALLRNIQVQETFSVFSSTVNKKEVAIIGGAGYVGSFLALALRDNAGFYVTIFDKDPEIDETTFNGSVNPILIVKAHSTSITKDDLAAFGTVIFLGGCTGRKACDELTTQEVETENILHVIDIMKKMSSSQHFIAASTSAVAEGTFDAKEDSKVTEALLDSYSLSMFKREVRLREFVEHDKDRRLPQISLLRFGTVVGNSPGQRTDLMIPSFFRSAYTTGALSVGGHNTMRSFLTLDDLGDAFSALISQANAAFTSSRKHFSVWNLASFDATVFKIAATVASLTGAKIDASPSYSGEQSPLLSSRDSGFSLNTEAFEDTFNFTFKGSLNIAVHDFDHNIPESIIPKGPHRTTESESGNVMPCPVCGATGQQTVLDLGSQPLANDFFPDVADALTRPRFPLKLVRCKVCNHYHLSNLVDRSKLFEHYLYQSGTSATLSEYFEWLAQRVISDSGLPANESGSILEIACNDGSQLDHFKTKGWKTYGVDPATNLAAIAARSHTVKNGFWPTDFPELPTGNDLTAITAQNVAAHVPDVVAFLKGCADVMGPKTMLYVQTSQCNMQQLGQFDTVYHEHISFFTGHSFLKAAELSGLVIVSFETTPIHGESCLVKMQLDPMAAKRNIWGAAKASNSNTDDTMSPSLQGRLLKEKENGITSDFFAMKFSAHASMIRDWLKKELSSFKKQGSIVVGYGAAAKGMVLLHFILGDKDNGSSYLDFVLDDAKLKQDTFCPGTVIPVKPTSSLLEYSDFTKPLVIMVFAWNFFDEIAKKIIGMLKGKRNEVIFLVPFPSPRVIRVDLKADDAKQVIRELSYLPTQIPNPITYDKNRTKAIMVTHQRNEELLMPFFIMQHAPMFDKVFLIDFDSDDHTLEILERFAPPSWKVVASETGSVFDAVKTDDQVARIEKQYPDDWLIALTTTEFLNKPQFRQYLREFEEKRENKGKPFISCIQGFDISGNNSKPLVYSEPLPKQRQLGIRSRNYNRHLHYKTSTTYHYTPGRHQYKGRGADNISFDAFIFKFAFAPWPEVRYRKMNVGKTIPESDVKQRKGFQHTQRMNEALLDAEYKKSQKFHTDFCIYDGTWVGYKRVYNQLYGKCG